MEHSLVERAGTSPEPELVVTVAGREHVVWRSLVRQAIPMLESPEGYSTFERRQLAQTLTAALELDGERGDLDGGDATPEDAPPEYEPGCDLEEGFWDGEDGW